MKLMEFFKFSVRNVCVFQNLEGIFMVDFFEISRAILKFCNSKFGQHTCRTTDDAKKIIF
jgi:hypothetical protein